MIRRPAVLPSLVLIGLLGTWASARATSVTLTWTAPGDDGESGTAAQYDVRYSDAPLDSASFGAAPRLPGAPDPRPAGSPQSFVVTGLAPATRYWFAVRTADDQGNWSGVSNIASFTTRASLDTVRPAAPEVRITASGATSVALAWFATGDDSLGGTASRYDVRWSRVAIDEAGWSSATPVPAGVPSPAAPGTEQAMTIGGLDRSADLWLALRVGDAAGNWSAPSAPLRLARLPDTAPPGTPTGLSATLEAGGVRLRWNPNVEPDLAGYQLYRAVNAGGAFTPLGGPTAATEALDAAAPPAPAAWYALTAVDVSANESARTAALRVALSATASAALALQPPYPNPSGLGGPVNIPIAVTAGGVSAARLDIVDCAGERVRSYPLQGLAPGAAVVVWDGRNEHGRPCAPGLYRVLLVAGQDRQTGRLLRR